MEKTRITLGCDYTINNINLLKKKKIFICGFCGSGTRVPTMILERAGYFVGGEYVRHWPEYDINGKEPNHNVMTIYYDDNYFRKNPIPLKNYLKEVINERDEWAIKYPIFMFIIPLLKEWYPDSEVIYVRRNPVDVMSHPVHYEFNWQGGLPRDAAIDDKLRYYIQSEKKILEYTDHIVKFEDLCFNTNDTIRDLLRFANVEVNNVDVYSDLIKIPQTIGRGKEHYQRIKEMKEFDYIKELGYLLD